MIRIGTPGKITASSRGKFRDPFFLEILSDKFTPGRDILSV